MMLNDDMSNIICWTVHNNDDDILYQLSGSHCIKGSVMRG